MDDDDWRKTRITFAIIMEGTAEDILLIKENLPSILPEGIKIKYQQRSILPLYITELKPKGIM